MNLRTWLAVGAIALVTTTALPAAAQNWQIAAISQTEGTIMVDTDAIVPSKKDPARIGYVIRYEGASGDLNARVTGHCSAMRASVNRSDTLGAKIPPFLLLKSLEFACSTLR